LERLRKELRLPPEGSIVEIIKQRFEDNFKAIKEEMALSEKLRKAVDRLLDAQKPDHGLKQGPPIPVMPEKKGSPE
jgi:hypothetical protein